MRAKKHHITMKKHIFTILLLSISTILFAQKNVSVEYQESSTRNLEPEHYMVIAPLIADLQVSPTKITFTEKEAYKKFPVTTETAKAIKEIMPELKKIALSRAAKTHNADLLVGTIIDVITNSEGLLEITVSGYPAKYVNFRNATEQDMDVVREARIATYGQDNLEILHTNSSTNVKIKE